MGRFRQWALVALAVSTMALYPHRDARAAAEVHRMNLVISGVPTQVTANDFNDFINEFNRTALDPFGIEGLKTIDFAWLFDAELRYFVRPNVAVSAGVGQLRQQSKREFLPAISQDVQLRAEILSVPVHVGGAYYLQPYTQGDFQARVYMGGGFSSLVYNRARLHMVAIGFDSLTARAANFQITGQGDSPGFYLESGVHMFFAARYSVMLGLLYRSAKIRDAEGFLDVPQQPRMSIGRLFGLDTSGVGARLAIAIGL